jgi:hypothetical protein
VADRRQTRPLVREGPLHRQHSNFQTENNIWSQVPEWNRHQDIATDWSSVVTWLWLHSMDIHWFHFPSYEPPVLQGTNWYTNTNSFSKLLEHTEVRGQKQRCGRAVTKVTILYCNLWFVLCGRNTACSNMMWSVNYIPTEAFFAVYGGHKHQC